MDFWCLRFALLLIILKWFHSSSGTRLYLYCDKRILGGIYGEIKLESKVNSERKARGISLGLRLLFTVFLDLSNNTDILNYNSRIVIPGRAILEKLILRIAMAAGAIFSSIFPALLGVYWKICPPALLAVYFPVHSQ